jgi:glutamine synthetase
MYKPGKEKATRVELRSPDPACNPYLAFSVMLAAGLDGIRRGLELPADVTDNIYEMSDVERTACGITQLPESLNEALAEMEKSELVREALGDQVFEWFLRNKRIEWHDYRTRVTQWERDSYLAIL